MINKLNNNNIIFCNNCSKKGHLFHQCKIPITSIGIIVFRKNNNKFEILLIRRKDSLGFVDFLRGKYNLDNINYIINLFNNMTLNEREFIKNTDFNELWKYLWGDGSTNQYKNEEKLSKYKFYNLKNGYKNNNTIINLDFIINNCNKNYLEPEWGFPKGRRNFQESDLKCGLREFEEETGYNENNLNVISNILPFEEIFTGSNYKSYKHKYFLAYINHTNEPEKHFQINEVSKIKWVPLDEAVNYIRSYNIEKIKIILELNKLLNTYKLYM